jgi:uncharacterized protein DUF5654
MRQDVIKAFTGLITAAFGLVAALAWNSAIQEIFAFVFGEQSGVYALIIYAVIVTIIAVIATLAIGRVAAKAGLKEEEEKPVDQGMEDLKSELQSMKGELRIEQSLETLRSEVQSLKEELRKMRQTEAA